MTSLLTSSYFVSCPTTRALIWWLCSHKQTQSFTKNYTEDRLSTVVLAGRIWFLLFSFRWKKKRKSRRESSSIKINWCKCETNRKLLLGTLKHSVRWQSRFGLYRTLLNIIVYWKPFERKLFLSRVGKKELNCTKKCWSVQLYVGVSLESDRIGYCTATEALEPKQKSKNGKLQTFPTKIRI